MPLLQIDESVRLTLTNVFFTKPTIILIGNDRQLTLTGLTNLAL
jgi:hypothetical protein